MDIPWPVFTIFITKNILSTACHSNLRYTHPTPLPLFAPKSIKPYRNVRSVKQFIGRCFLYGDPETLITCLIGLPPA